MELIHGLRTPREEIAFTARPKIKSQFQIFRYGRSIFCLPHRTKISDFFDLFLHWVSVVRAFERCWSVLLHKCLIMTFTQQKIYLSLSDTKPTKALDIVFCCVLSGLNPATDYGHPMKT